MRQAPPCKSMCTAADCMATMMSQVSMACTTCLEAQAMMEMNSACTTMAGETCIGDTTCSAFVTCEIGCP